MNVTYQVITPITFFKIDKSVDINLGLGFKILSGSEIEKKIDDELRSYLGGYQIDLIKNNFCFYLEVKIPFDPALTAGKFAHLINSYISTFVKSLWFIRDNSCSIENSFVQIIELKTVGQGGIIGFNCDSNDLLSVTNFTEKELYNHREVIYPFFKKYLDLFDKPIDQPDLPRNKQITYVMPKVNFLSYDPPRITRALLLLNDLREKGSMITKITFYMAIFECLFSTRGDKIQEKIAQRGASFAIETEADEQYLSENNDLIKKAYDIRSSYMHGDIVELSRDELLKLSKSIDTLTRKILLKILKTSNPNFTSGDSKGDKKRFRKYIKDVASKYYPDEIETGIPQHHNIT